MKSKTIYFLFLLFSISCNGQNKGMSNNCSSKEQVIQMISGVEEVKERQKYIDSISNKTRGVSYIVTEAKIKAKEYFEVKTGYNGKLRWETYYIFYINKNDCDIIYINDVISGEIISLHEWRKKKLRNIISIETKELHFYDLFREGQTIKFTPEDLKATASPEMLEFRKKLKIFEDYDPMINGISSDDLTLLINNETFFDSQRYVNSKWLDYFLTKYNLYYAYNELMTLAIKQEDLNAVIILIKHKYIFSVNDVRNAKSTKENQSFELEENIKDGYDSYLLKESKIDYIFKIVTENYNSNRIFDKDGYTNLREGKGSNFSIIGKINSGEHIYVLDNPDEEDWYIVQTKQGKRGYVHKSRIVSE